MRGILFDKDGTLVDFGAIWPRLYRELCEELAEGDGETARRMLIAGGMDPDSGVVRAGSVLAAGNTRDIVTAWFPALGGSSFEDMVSRVDAAFHANGVRYSVLVPGAREALEELAATDIAMGVATSDGTAGTRAALANLGLEDRLPHVFGYDSVPRPKPAPDMVHAFAAAIGASAAEIAVVGDNIHDLEMARSAGAGAAIGVLSGTGRREDLAPLADAVLEGVRDLPAWLRSLQKPA
jgi:phosphoglycolate phosphatase